MKTWIQELAGHYEASRNDYPEDKLIVIFDVDGTILDSRHIIRHALKAFDKKNNTGYFDETDLDDIDFHEDHVDRIAERLGMSPRHSVILNNSFLDLLRASATNPEIYCPFDGVFKIIRTLQDLPDTYVGLNTGRTEDLRFCTLQNLNGIGSEHGVRFADELLFMQPHSWQGSIKALKQKGIEYFKTKGYRVIAFFDNEPENLHVVSRIDPKGEILLLHADTIFKSSPSMLPGQAVKGNIYDPEDFRLQRLSANHLEYVWQCDFKEENFSRFIGSNIGWLQMSLEDLMRGVPRTTDNPFGSISPLLALSLMKEHGKGIKIDMRSAYASCHPDRLVKIIDKLHLDPSLKWFTIGAEELRAGCLSWLRSIYPLAVIEFSIDYLISSFVSDPWRMRTFMETLSLLGVSRFSVKWQDGSRHKYVLSLLNDWGLEAHVDDIGEFRNFLQAAELSPCSLTINLSSTGWKYFNGIGEEESPDSPLLQHTA